MCLITEKLPEILKEDLVVYKLLHEDLTSIFNSYQYKYNDLCLLIELIPNCEEDYLFANFVANRYYSADNDPQETLDNLERFHLFGYNKGYHFYITKEKALQSAYIDTYILVECIVPRGSTIVYDSTELGVASQIKITKILEK